MIALSDYKFIHQLRKLARLHWPILAKYLKVDLKELNLWASGKEIPEVYKLQVQQLVLDLEKLSYDDRCKKVIELLGPELHKEQIALRKHQNEQLDKRYSSFPIYGTGPMIDDGSVHKEIGIVRIAKSIRVNVKE